MHAIDAFFILLCVLSSRVFYALISFVVVNAKLQNQTFSYEAEKRIFILV